MMNLKAGNSNLIRFALLLLLAAGVAAFFALGGHRRISFEELVAHKDALIGLASEHPVLSGAGFVACYLMLGLFGLPGSTVLNLTAGLLFNFVEGLVLVLLASTLASSLAFLSFRYMFREFVEAKVRARFPHLDEDLRREGAYFVFAMRLFPVIPYSVTNLVLAVSPVSFPVYLGFSLLALLPRYLLYVYAGTHLGEIRSPSDIVSPSMIGVLALLAVLPWILKWTAPRIKRLFVRKT
jgi:uncharacterized membrane protein YdjX (TVP38/TMEM64 family)